MEIIRLVEGSDLPVKMALRQLGVPRSTFYGWYGRYEMFGFDGLQESKVLTSASRLATASSGRSTRLSSSVSSCFSAVSLFRMSNTRVSPADSGHVTHTP